MARRRPDRAQKIRSRRLWWSRHEAFTRGVAVGAFLVLLVIWVVRAFGIRAI
jgi:hypothetical protein